MTTAAEPTAPPSPVWRDETTNLAVWVNGGLIEISGPECARVSPNDAALLPAGFDQAIRDASAWAVRWDGVARCYRAEVTA